MTEFEEKLLIVLEQIAENLDSVCSSIDSLDIIGKHQQEEKEDDQYARF